MILLTPRCPPYVLPCVSARTSVTFLLGNNYMSHLLLPVDRLPVTFKNVVFQRIWISLGPVALVNWAPVTDVPPLWALCNLSLLSVAEVVVCQLLPPQGLPVPAFSSGSSHYQYPLAVRLLFHHFAVGALLEAWASGKGVCVGVSDALTVFGCEIVLLYTLEPSSCLSLQIPEAQQPG